MSAPVAAVFVAVGLTVAPAASSADGPRPVTAFAASLGPGGERPAPNGVKTGAGGLVRAIVTQSGANSTISWSLTFAHLTGPALSAHVYLGKPGEPGASALSLCQPCRTGQRGNAPLSVGVATALANGGAYVNVETKANPDGEIRGQVGTSHALVAGLQTAAETPAPQSPPSGAGGTFSALVIDVAPRPRMVWSLSVQGLSGAASAAHIQLGQPGVSGPVTLTLCAPCTSSLAGRRSIDANLATAIQDGGYYVNVTTAANPGGEVRGQLIGATQGVAAFTTSLGSILVDDRGFTLYDFVADKTAQSTCYGRCATFWPPALAYRSPIAAPDTTATLLSLAARTDGTTMLVYNGHPVYTFLPDANIGDLKGQGSTAFGAPWWVLDGAAGTEITTKP